MSIMENIRSTMEAASGLTEMIDAAIDCVDPDESYNDLDINVYGELDDEDDLEIDSDVGEEDDADIDEFLEKDEKDRPLVTFSDAKPLCNKETGGVKISSDESGEVDPDVGEEDVADIEDALESLMALLEGDEGTEILTGNDVSDDTPDDYVQEEETEELEINELDDDDVEIDIDDAEECDL